MFWGVTGTQQPKDQLSEFTKTQSVSYMQSNP